MAKARALLFSALVSSRFSSPRSTGDQESIDSSEPSGDSSSTTITAKPAKVGRLRALSLATAAARHLDCISKQADSIESA